LFSLGLGVGNNVERKEKDGRVKRWRPEGAQPRMLMTNYSYRQAETEAVRKFTEVSAFLSRPE
jgi:hypothetical protein